MSTPAGNPSSSPAAAGSVADTSTAGASDGSGGWLHRIDHWAERIGDRFNPILVKESRQTLKSRQFIITFSLLLLAAWGWTAAAIALMMPRIYYVPSGQALLIGYYLVLAGPMLLVVPLAAHRSLASEVDDGTLDLLSVTNLSPLQIISGKLASAALQMMLYFVALVPCVAFCYVLRGVDLLTIVMLLGSTLLVASLLTVVGLFLAALPNGRAGQFVMMVVMLVLVTIAEFGFGGMAIAMITEGVDRTPRFLGFAIVAAVLFTVTASAILLIAAAAQLAPPSENRSTPIRWALLVHQTTMLGCLGFAVLVLGADVWTIVPFLYCAAAFWAVMGGLMVGELGALTPRIRRDLPATFIGRAFTVWFNPGSGTGLVFSVTCFLIAAGVIIFLGEFVPSGTRYGLQPPLQHALMLAGYLMLFLSLTRGLMQLIRLRVHAHPGLAVAVLVIVSGLAAVIPYSAALHYHDYRSFAWTRWQATNWMWTIGQLESGLPDDVPYLVFGMGATLFALNLVLLGPAVLPQRIATPERVLAERAKAEQQSGGEGPGSDVGLDLLSTR